MRPKRQHVIFLECLLNTHQEQRRKILESISSDQVHFLSSVLFNVLKSNILLQENHRKRLLKHASLIRRLANKSTPDKVKKELYNKHYKLVVTIFKPLLSQLEERFCHGKGNGAGT